MTALQALQMRGEAPVWMTEEGWETLKSSLSEGDSETTPRQIYTRLASMAWLYSGIPAAEFFYILWSGWLCPASPVLSNFGTDRGLPISCNALTVPDSVNGIFDKVKELAVLSKNGAGVATYMGEVRGRGAPITNNGLSEGVMPWCKVFDSTTISVNQGSTRRGAAAVYLDITHPDIREFLSMRRPTGDVNRRSLNLHHGVCVPDSWMESMLGGDALKREIWIELLKTRFETGEPYIFFTDTVNRQNPYAYVKNNLSCTASNLCSEICLTSDEKHTFVCCLSSLNLEKYDEWKDTNVVELSIRFLDAVMEEYIQKTHHIPELQCAYRFAVKSRALGLGVLGWHSYLQKNGIPFESFRAMMLNGEIFRTIQSRAEAESRKMYDEAINSKADVIPEWCEGTGMFHTHLMAIAPTTSNSTIAGGFSQGIEPIAANYYVVKGAKGTFIRKNSQLEKVLETYGENTQYTWDSINENSGSVRHLEFLSASEKEVFLTAREINPYAIIQQASQRQKWVDQSQSLNLFFPKNANPRVIHDVHVEAWKSGVKTLYYLRTEGVLRGDATTSNCKSCEG
jgi:ribonucleoside-diphosphate reductase alpha chain